MKSGRVLLLIAIALPLAACSTTPPAGSPPPDPTPNPTGAETAVPTISPAENAVPTPNAAESDEPAAAADPLLAFELVDVRSGETFTLADLSSDKPVLLETMAIWCTTCLSQQREVVAAHGLADFHSVGIDVDPNERAPDLAAYAEREGFDWPFAVADRELVQLLTERFGFEVTIPPATPTFIVSDGTIRALEFGRLRGAEELVDELAAG
jgi:thiol-disulfide isomerase/thioredoxin